MKEYGTQYTDCATVSGCPLTILEVKQHNPTMKYGMIIYRLLASMTSFKSRKMAKTIPISEIFDEFLTQRGYIIKSATGRSYYLEELLIEFTSSKNRQIRVIHCVLTYFHTRGVWIPHWGLPCPIRDGNISSK